MKTKVFYRRKNGELRICELDGYHNYDDAVSEVNDALPESRSVVVLVAYDGGLK